jgi:methionyl-tRNA formyltransferase
MSERPATVLFLGPVRSPLAAWLAANEPSVLQRENKIDAEFIDENHIDTLVSYGYRHILDSTLLDKLPERAVNLHISLLPWNRGADPNLWSFIDNTPKGVTIHYLDEGVDTGDIIAQREIEFAEPDAETLASTYRQLDVLIQQLFRECWPAIKAGTCSRRSQSGPGSYHAIADRAEVAGLLTNGWDTPVSALCADTKRTTRD